MRPEIAKPATAILFGEAALPAGGDCVGDEPGGGEVDGGGDEAGPGGD